MTRNSPRLLVAMAVAAITAALSGCEVDMSDRISSGPTTEQTRAQVIDAAREIAAALPSPVHAAWFWRGSCGDPHGDGGDAPSRAQMRIGYDRAASSAVSEAQIAAAIARLRAAGWATATGFRSRSVTLEKNGVHAVFRAQNASTATRGVEVLGGCSTIPETTAGDGRPERIDLAEDPGGPDRRSDPGSSPTRQR